MSLELYDAQETRLAMEALEVLGSTLPGTFLLLGGWAVYLTVSDSFRKEHGSPYLGSRDVDIGFHIDEDARLVDLRRSDFAKAIAVLKDVGYFPMGSYRFCKIVNRIDGKELNEAEAKRVSMHDLFYLYVDVMVDHIHPDHQRAFGLKPLDEPMLATVFEEDSGIVVAVGGSKVMVPSPEHLLATKLRSIVSRDHEDKLIKDACDIYALMWHSDLPFREIAERVRMNYPNECASAQRVIDPEVARRASVHLGVEVERFAGVVGLLSE
jgi:hypothetical protein